MYTNVAKVYTNVAKVYTIVAKVYTNVAKVYTNVAKVYTILYRPSNVCTTLYRYVMSACQSILSSQRYIPGGPMVWQYSGTNRSVPVQSRTQFC